MSDIEAEVSTIPAQEGQYRANEPFPPGVPWMKSLPEVVAGEVSREPGSATAVHACRLCGKLGADRQRSSDGGWVHESCFLKAPVGVDVEDSIAEVAAADNARRLEQMRRVRRAAVNRLIDFVRIEQLALSGPNDRTSVEELTHDAIMKALDLYFEGRPKASPDSMSMAIDTLEKIQGIKPKGGKP